jgi:hypothetical protein
MSDRTRRRTFTPEDKLCILAETDIAECLDSSRSPGFFWLRHLLVLCRVALADLATIKMLNRGIRKAWCDWKRVALAVAGLAMVTFQAGAAGQDAVRCRRQRRELR